MAQIDRVDHAAQQDSGDRPYHPLRVIELELSEPLPPIRREKLFTRAWVLARLHGEPLGSSVIDIDEYGLAPTAVGKILWREFRSSIVERFLAAGLPAPSAVDDSGLQVDPAQWPFLLRRAHALRDAPSISIVICTRDRTEQLATCLARLDRQKYPRFEVLVVENVPKGNDVRRLLETWEGSIQPHYFVEHRSGLSWSRNTGVSAASGEIVAFLDDDAEPDENWLAGLACGFARGDDIGSVTGLILPARLDTPAQELFETLGGHSKGRGFTPEIFSWDGPQSPLYPLPPFGAGANLAFRREAFRKIGGLDVALGGGTPTRAGADTLALTLTLLEGYRVAYEPAALMWHHHRREWRGLQEQLDGYSVGLTAFYTALLRQRPSLLPRVLQLAPKAASYLRRTRTTSQTLPAYLSHGIDRKHLSGMLRGPVAYAKSRRIQARLSSPH